VRRPNASARQAFHVADDANMTRINSGQPGSRCDHGLGYHFRI